MRLTLHCVGKLKLGSEKELAEDYATRINQLARRAGLIGLEQRDLNESKAQETVARQSDESQRLLAGLPDSTALIVFDGRGTPMTTEAFAKLIADHAAKGTPALSFAIGGPDGHDDALRKRAVKVIALGAMTWPHRLVRIMVLEQIYRAITIMVNHPYHRA